MCAVCQQAVPFLWSNVASESAASDATLHLSCSGLSDGPSRIFPRPFCFPIARSQCFLSFFANAHAEDFGAFLSLLPLGIVQLPYLTP